MSMAGDKHNEQADEKWCPTVGEIEELPTIDLEQELWDLIKRAAEESNWIPKEHYFMNDWVSDVCQYLREGVKGLNK